MADVPLDLPSLRSAIERIDHDLLTLLRERMEVVDGVARAKLQTAVPIRDPRREEQVLQGVRAQAVRLGLDAHEVERLYRLIMDMAVARQQALVTTLDDVPLRVAYAGSEGSYSHLAAQSRYSHRPGGTLLTGYDSVRAAAQAVRLGRADVALLPIENTTAGSMNETYDLLADGGLTLNAEVIRPLDHRLLVLPGVRVEELRRVLSHPQALQQCAHYFATLPDVILQAELDTAGAAQTVRLRNDRTLAAVASASAALLYGLEALPVDIQSGELHFTRYGEVAVEATPCPPDVPCKTSILLVLEHRPGTLGQVLNVFARHGVNLSKLESRPVTGASLRYRFYVDLEGHAASREVGGAFDELRPAVSELRVLGTYPRAHEVQA